MGQFFFLEKSVVSFYPNSTVHAHISPLNEPYGHVEPNHVLGINPLPNRANKIITIIQYVAITEMSENNNQRLSYQNRRECESSFKFLGIYFKPSSLAFSFGKLKYFITIIIHITQYHDDLSRYLIKCGT